MAWESKICVTKCRLDRKQILGAFSSPVWTTRKRRIVILLDIEEQNPAQYSKSARTLSCNLRHLLPQILAATPLLPIRTPSPNFNLPTSQPTLPPLHLHHKMPTWKILPCTSSDGKPIAINTTHAFWDAPMWRLQWRPDITLSFLTEQLIKRQPLRLLRERDTLRHLKAVDPETGELVGYSRWRLPDNHVLTSSGEVEWKEAQIPDVSAETRKELEEAARGVWWDPRTDVDVLDEDNGRVKGEVVKGREVLVLEFLAVHPRNKGNGIGTALVEAGLKQARRMGLSVLIVSYRASKGVYERLGFRVMGKVEKDDTAFGGDGDYSWFFMVWEGEKDAQGDAVTED